MLRLYDVESGHIETATQGHKNMRDSRVLFVNRDFLLTTGELL